MSRISDLTQLKSKLIADAIQIAQAGLKTPESREQYKNILEEADIVQGDLDTLLRIEMTRTALKNRQPARTKSGIRRMR